TLNQGNPRKTFLNFRNNLLMLYKNLPDQELGSVMRVRCFLDYLAAFQFLLKGDVKNFSAVFKARRAYHKMRPDFEKDRRHIQQLRQNERVPERVEFSLLWQYYIKGRKTFNELMIERK
ncbi:MAG: glycosyltransferase family 2 protein, partial [Bacteroidaceae bacterium]|nr:glycosyltransferase family 2 protein [Bacteroidaceae bacterium]